MTSWNKALSWYLPRTDDLAVEPKKAWNSFYAGLVPHEPPPSLDEQVELSLGLLEREKNEGQYQSVRRESHKLLGIPGLSAGQRCRALMLRAESLLLQGDALEALPLFEQILQQEPQNARAMYSLGKVAMCFNLRDKAKVFFEAALQSQPDFAPAAEALRAIG